MPEEAVTFSSDNTLDSHNFTVSSAASISPTRKWRPQKIIHAIKLLLLRFMQMVPILYNG